MSIKLYKHMDMLRLIKRIEMIRIGDDEYITRDEFMKLSHTKRKAILWKLKNLKPNNETY